jgi:hypothetical protein
MYERSMSDQAGSRVFRSPRWYVAFVGVAALLFATGAWYTYSSRGLHFWTFVAVAMAIIGIVGVVEVTVDRVVLTDDALHVIRIWSRRRYDKSQIVNVTQMKGTPVTLKLADGRWAQLPSVAVHPNTIRAWLRSGSTDP